MAWRKADNWTAFTNGYLTWINGPNGLVSRLNTDRFPWESQLSKVLLSDNFDDPTKGVLPATSPGPSLYVLGYVGGEYQMKGLAAADRLSWVTLPGLYTDTSVSIDVRLVGSTTRVRVFIACRSQGPDVTFTDAGYRLFLGPDSGLVQIIRRDPGTDNILAEGQSNAVLRGGASNHLELRCTGTRIAALVNGTEVFAVNDGTYRQGAIRIGMRLADPGDARFDNLTVAEAG